MTWIVPAIPADELHTSVLSAKAKVDRWNKTLKSLKADLAARLMADVGVTPGLSHVRAVHHEEPMWLVTGGHVLFPDSEQLGPYLLVLECTALNDDGQLSNRLICTTDWELIDA